MKKQKYHKWTVAQLQQLIGDWCAGMSLDAMCEKYGATRFAITKQVLRMRKDGVAIPRRTPGHVPEQCNKLWSQGEVEYLIRRRNDRATAEQIASELGRTFLGVQAMIRKLRDEGVPVQMLGNGVRRQWDAEQLKGAVAGKGLVRQEVMGYTAKSLSLVKAA